MATKVLTLLVVNFSLVVCARIISPPQNHSAIVGDTIQFDCNVDEMGNYTLIWLRGAINLFVGDRRVENNPR